jgi:hypothetical protein
MEHIVVGRTAMTTPAWLQAWIDRQRRSPRRASPDRGGAAGPRPRARQAARDWPALPPPRREVSDS